MGDLKMDAATAALTLISDGQTIGLGAGTTIAHLVRMIKDSQLMSKDHQLIFTSSSFNTLELLREQGLPVVLPSSLKKIDIYFDGCDQLDKELNALKSGGGIHTTEKILASMADEFILLGDGGKYVEQLNATFPLVIEILPQALAAVQQRLIKDFPEATYTLRKGPQKDGAVISDNGNFLVDLKFIELPELNSLNTHIKMIPGVVEHSLFYQMATKAIIARSAGIEVLS
jgi:ribose 5-phosphate isomerase A